MNTRITVLRAWDRRGVSTVKTLTLMLSGGIVGQLFFCKLVERYDKSMSLMHHLLDAVYVSLHQHSRCILAPHTGDVRLLQLRNFTNIQVRDIRLRFKRVDNCPQCLSQESWRNRRSGKRTSCLQATDRQCIYQNSADLRDTFYIPSPVQLWQ